MSLALRIDEERELARLEKTISVLRRLRGQLNDKALANAFDLDLLQLNTFLETIDANPDKTDWEIAEIIYG